MINLQRLRQAISLPDSKRKVIICEVENEIELNRIPRENARNIGAELIDLVASETNPDLRECELDALFKLTLFHASLDLDWCKLRSLLHQLPSNELEFLIAILGSSSNSDVLTWIEPFKSHSEEFVRLAAVDAIKRIDASRSNTEL